MCTAAQPRAPRIPSISDHRDVQAFLSFGSSVGNVPRSLVSSLVPSFVVLISSCAMAEPQDPVEISALLQEDRVFKPPAAFRDRANVRDTSSYDEAERDFEGFW